MLCELSCNPDAPNGILHIRLYVLVDFICNHYSFHDPLFLPSLFSAENHLRYLVIYVTKKSRENSEGFKSSFLADNAAALHA